MIYLVEAQFNSYDSYYTQIVGIFDDPKMAKLTQKKWDTFFEDKKKEIFGPFNDKSMRDENDDWVNDEIEHDYYQNESEYRLILEFRNIIIRELKLNEDWLNSDYIRNFTQSFCITSSESQLNLMKQFSIEYNREQNLNELVDDK